MKFRIANIARNHGESMDIQASEHLEGLTDDFGDYVFNNPVSVKGKLTNTGGRINMEVEASANYETKCSRCLKDISRECNLSIVEDFVAESSNEASDTEPYTYQGEWLEIDKAVVDGILLALPFVQLCKQDCKGLCPDCGIDLNKESCDCEENRVNLDMVKLKNLFEDNDESLKDRG